MKSAKQYKKNTLPTVFAVLTCSSISCLSEEISGDFPTVKKNNYTRFPLDCYGKKEDSGEICFKWKAVNYLNGLVKAKEPISITDYLSLVRTSKENETFNEGRKKGKYKDYFKKDGGILMMAGTMAGLMMKMFMVGVAGLAGKALAVAKIALLLSLATAIQKLVTGKGGDTKVVYTTSEQGGGGWLTKYHERYMQLGEDGPSLAYNANDSSKFN